jgi:hypothetical protein
MHQDKILDTLSVGHSNDHSVDWVYSALAIPRTNIFNTIVIFVISNGALVNSCSLEVQQVDLALASRALDCSKFSKVRPPSLCHGRAIDALLMNCSVPEKFIVSDGRCP